MYNMKKNIILIIVFVLLIFFGEDIYHNLLDYIYWKQVSSNIKINTISKIDLELKNPIELKDDEKNNFIEDLNKAKFYKSNWHKVGPTGTIVSVIFNNNRKVYFEYWGNSIFELTMNGEQFLIKSASIESVIKKYNISP